MSEVIGAEPFGPQVESVWRASAMHGFDLPLSHTREGDLGRVAILGDPPQYIAKTPKREVMTGAGDSLGAYTIENNNRALLDFESLVLAEIGEAMKYTTGTPVDLPKVINHVPEGEDYPFAVYTYVKGENLTTRDVHALSTEEKLAAGEKISGFALWFSDLIPPSCYQRIVHETNANIKDRKHQLLEWNSDNLIELEKRGHESLVIILENLIHQCLDYEVTEGFAEKHLIHDDITPNNTAWTKNGDKHYLSGVFDFGVTKLGSIEREFRHIPIYFGDEALSAAIKHYEYHSNQTLDPELIGFWSLAQAATNTGARIINDTEVDPVRAGFLMRCFPDLDWREFDGITVSH